MTCITRKLGYKSLTNITVECSSSQPNNITTTSQSRIEYQLYMILRPYSALNFAITLPYAQAECETFAGNKVLNQFSAVGDSGRFPSVHGTCF